MKHSHPGGGWERFFFFPYGTSTAGMNEDKVLNSMQQLQAALQSHSAAKNEFSLWFSQVDTNKDLFLLSMSVCFAHSRTFTKCMPGACAGPTGTPDA